MVFPFLTGKILSASGLNDAFSGLLSQFAAQNSIATDQSTTSTTYTDLTSPGPAVTITSRGTLAWIMWSAHTYNNTANCGTLSSIAISGVTTLAAADVNGAHWHEHASANASDECAQFMLATINAGANTYTMKYKRAAGGTAHWERRRLLVFAP